MRPFLKGSLMKRTLFLIGALLFTPNFFSHARIFVPVATPQPQIGVAAVNSPSAANRSGAISFVAPYNNLPKLDATLSLLVKSQAQTPQTPTTRATVFAPHADNRQITTPDGTFHLNEKVAFNLVTLDDKTPLVLRTIERLGGTARTITDNFLLVEMPIDQLQTLAQLPEVVEMAMPQHAAPTMKEARHKSHVDEVHAGKSLYTPFKGKNVIIAVIDQGFEFRHAAFLDKDGNSRVKWLWDRSGYSTYATSNRSKSPTDEIPVGTDFQDHGAKGHGTHTTGIAAGSDVGNDQYGVAPEADIIMIPSTFIDTEVLEDVQFVKTKAKLQQKPWVVNMSFGSQEGPHDGSRTYDQKMSRLGGEKGGILVASAGNNGDKQIHVKSTIPVSQTRYVIFDYPNFERLTEDEKKKKIIVFDLWAQSTDGIDRLEIKPFLLINNKVEFMDKAFWDKYAWFFDSKSATNNKYQTKVWCQLPRIRLDKNDPSILFGLRITNSAKDKEELVHGWVSQDGSYVKKSFPKIPNNQVLQGDNYYTIADAGGNIPAAITVGAYTSRSKHTNKLTNKSYDLGMEIGSRSYFSSMGPVLNTAVKKPTVLAPGAQVCSAMNQLYPGFDEKNWMISEKVKVNGEDFYYADEQGTSMSAPYVAGVIALWLEANPNLTHTDIEKILEKTSFKLQGASNVWTKEEGYGRINAYEGLKMALKMANIDLTTGQPISEKPTAIERVSGSAQPVTLQGDKDEWKVLFNNPERTATLSFLTLDGRVVLQRNLQQIAQGQEETFSLAHLPSGIYLLRVATPGAQITHRVIVSH